MAKKGKNALRQLVNEEHPNTGTKYIVEISKNPTQKLRFRKYDPVVKKHCWFVEKRMPSHSK